MKQGKGNRALPREHTGHSKHPLPQHKRRLYTWTSPDSQHQNQIDYILGCDYGLLLARLLEEAI